MRRVGLAVAILLCALSGFAQSVSPVIVQYKRKASGSFSLSNNTLEPLAVVLEPRSFSIDPEGNGNYRPLDADIHLQLSSMSFLIEPGQTHYVFYKATAGKLPAWFSIYSIFSSARHRDGLDVRVLLPHTVYIYPPRPLSKKNEVIVESAEYQLQDHQIICDISNPGPDLERVQSVRIDYGNRSVTAPGFPLLPGGRRHLQLKWTESQAPKSISFRFQSSTLQEPIATSSP